MPAPEMEDWLRSGTPASLGGVTLKPRTHPACPGFVLCMARSQGESYSLVEADGTRWFLKKFNPRSQPSLDYVKQIGRQLPLRKGFESGTHRTILTSSDLGGPYRTTDFQHWLEGTILMPHVPGGSWGDLIDRCVQGRGPKPDARLRIAIALAEHIFELETAGAAHRDLSGGNILVDDDKVHLIDWDAFYHDSLPFESNTTLGTNGYLAPWVLSDARLSWCAFADRYALAVCIGEIVGAEQGMRLHADGALLDQSGHLPTAESVSTLMAAVKHKSARLATLLRQALTATRFEECPSPRHWTGVLREMIPPERKAVHALDEQQTARFGPWSLRRDGHRLAVRGDGCCFELNLKGLGAFSYEVKGERGTWFTDGSRSRGCSLAVEWPADTRSDVLLDEQDALIYNYRFAFTPDGLHITNMVAERTLRLERDHPHCTLAGSGIVRKVTA